MVLRGAALHCSTQLGLRNKGCQIDFLVGGPFSGADFGQLGYAFDELKELASRETSSTTRFFQFVKNISELPRIHARKLGKTILNAKINPTTLLLEAAVSYTEVKLVQGPGSKPVKKLLPNSEHSESETLRSKLSIPKPECRPIPEDPSPVFAPPRGSAAEFPTLHQEVVHSFKQKKRKKGFVGFKLDFHKAYDCLNKSAPFLPSRGIRQGDPFSPYLFILCSEILARLVSREVENGVIKCVKLAPEAPCISKLSYADGVILFYGAKVAEVETLLHCVDKFSNKSKDFAFIMERLEARVNGWKSKCLSWSSRAILIKSVAQTTPIYGMSVFRFPKKLCEDLDALVRKF
uniref:Reverse transcriptase domain-containing protein n=1 Tax=Fagus sylvatica TaxID=28930 RepID=A0A2N9GXT2_FAGSY